MANRYVNLDYDSRPGSAGSAVDPYGRDEFQTNVVLGGSHTWYLRGANYLTTTCGSGIGESIQAWDINLYGPWRLNGAGIYTIGGSGWSLQQGILFDVATVFTSGVIRNCFMRILGNVTSTDFDGNCLVLTGNAIPINIGTWTNNVFAFTSNIYHVDPAPYGPIPITLTNNATSEANWGDFVNPTVPPAVDGGGQVYGIQIGTLPDWQEPDLTKFGLYFRHGLGIGPYWAAPTEGCIDIRAAYDTSWPRKGNPSAPATLAQADGGISVWLPESPSALAGGARSRRRGPLTPP